MSRLGLELVTRYLQPGIRRGANRVLPSSWGTPIVRLHMFQTDAGRTACTRPFSAAAWPLVIERQRLLRVGLSTLNSMAFGLAVYASQCGLLQHHARLASSCWSGSTGRAFHPQGSDERFQSCRLHLIPLSQACLAQSIQPTQVTNIRITTAEAGVNSISAPLVDRRAAGNSSGGGPAP